MSAENKALVRRWFEEVWNKGRVDAIAEMLAEDSVIHGLSGEMRGPEGFRPFHATFRDAMPDVRIVVDEVVAEGDLVAVRWTAVATHKGDSLGFAATNRRAEFGGMGIVRVRDGKIVEGWNTFDQLGMMQQLGVVNLPV